MAVKEETRVLSGELHLGFEASLSKTPTYLLPISTTMKRDSSPQGLILGTYDFCQPLLCVLFA